MIKKLGCVIAISIVPMILSASEMENVDEKTKIALETVKATLAEEPTIRLYIEDGVAIRRGKDKYAAACVSCHGPEGKSTNPIYPRLYKQRALYVWEQLRAFKNDIRTSNTSALMASFAKALSDQDMQDIGFYLQYAGSDYELQPKPPKNFKLPDTGQTQDLSHVWGEDGDYTNNSPSFSVDKERQVTVDNNTGLMWQTAGQEGMSMPKAHDYCSALDLGGYSDWRLPTIKELVTVVSYRSSQPAIDIRYFDNTPFGSSGYHAGPLIPGSIDTSWHIGFPMGHVMPFSAHANKFVRCARADDNAVYLYSDFKDNGNGTVTDKVTTLTWQQQSGPERRSWGDSIKYCENLELAGEKNWRLPNIVELVSLVDYTASNPSIDSTLFPGTPIGYHFWTSTSDITENVDNLLIGIGTEQRNETLKPGTKVENAGVAWAGSFQEGGFWRNPKYKENYARCVN